jgi:Ion channel
MTSVAAQPSDVPSTGEGPARHAMVLAALLPAFVIQGVAHPTAWEQVLVTGLLAATLLLAFRAARVRPVVMRSAVAVAVVMLAISIAEAATGHIDSATSRIANMLLVTLAPPAIVLGIVRTLRARNRVTLEAVFGVLCLFILLGMFFAFLYGAIGRVSGTFFAQGEPATVARCLYFSFTTLTTLGYGDLTATSNLGHTLSVSEALTGQIFLVTVVSVVIANLGRGRPNKA